MRVTGVLAVAAMTAVLVACGDQTEVSRDTPGSATPRALAAIAIKHIDADARRTRGEFSQWGDPEFVAADVDYGVDPEGSEDGSSLTVRLQLARLSEIPAEERQWVRCQAEQEITGGCTEEKVDGGILVYDWSEGEPEEDPGTAGYTFVHGDEVTKATIDGPFISRDPADDPAIDFDLTQLREVVLDPEFGFDMSADAIAAGADIPSYRGDEKPPTKPVAGATKPESLAAEVIRYAELTPSSARPSKLDTLGPKAVGAHLEVPEQGRWAPAQVDILTVAGKAPIVDPMPCTKVNHRVTLANGDGCFAWTDDNVVRWTKATGGEPAVIWLLGYHDNETYNRVETVAIRIVTPDLTEDLFKDPSLDVPDWWLSLGPLTTAMNVGPNREDPDAYEPVPHWQD